MTKRLFTYLEFFDFCLITRKNNSKQSTSIKGFWCFLSSSQSTLFVFYFSMVLILALFVGANPVSAKEAALLAENPAVEQRLNSIAEEMRCLVCQNESLAGSRSDLALDLRRELREQIKQGKSDAEIREFMVSRYGDFVLYRPPVKPTTWLLWAGPFVLMLLGVIFLARYLRRRNAEIIEHRQVQLTPEQTLQAQKLLEESSK